MVATYANWIFGIGKQACCGIQRKSGLAVASCGRLLKNSEKWGQNGTSRGLTSTQLILLKKLWFLQPNWIFSLTKWHTLCALRFVWLNWDGKRVIFKNVAKRHPEMVFALESHGAPLIFPNFNESPSNLDFSNTSWGTLQILGWDWWCSGLKNPKWNFQGIAIIFYI